ncbi:MAG TPA: hypothetical protein VF529_09720 [Solirubrobacteraceae bacterium]
MDTAVLTAIVSGGSAVAGIAVGGGIDVWQRIDERRERRLEQLESRLAMFGAALDGLVLEMESLPPQSRRGQILSEWLARRMPTLDFFVGRLGRALLGRRLYALMGDFQRAGNALVVSAPPEIVVAMEPIGDALGAFSKEPDKWHARFEEARADFAAVARIAAAGKLPRRRLRRRHRRELPPMPQWIPAALESPAES